MIRTSGFRVPFASTVALLCGVTCGVDGAVLDRQALDKVVSATVYVEVEREYLGEKLTSSASAFFIDGRGHLLTSWHAVRPEMPLRSRTADDMVTTKIRRIDVVINPGTDRQRRVPARTVAHDSESDLALLWCDSRSEAWLGLDDSVTPRLADEVWVVGYPFGSFLAIGSESPEVTVTRGSVTALRHGPSGSLELVQLDAAVNPGNSGGPVITDGGRLVGVTRAIVAGAANTAFAVPRSHLLPFAHEHRFRVNVSPPGVWDRSQPLKVTVEALLEDVPDNGLFTVVIEGSDIQPTETQLQLAGGILQGTVLLPGRVSGARRAASYRLGLRFDGPPVFQRTFSLPVYEPSDPERADGGSGGADDGAVLYPWDAVPTPVPTRAARSLAELAASTRLRHAEPVIDDHSVRNGHSPVDPWRYDQLQEGRGRALAQRFDELEAELMAASSNKRERSAAPPGSLSGEAEKRRRSLEARLEEARRAVEWSQLCRCSDGRWFSSGDPTACTGCEVPSSPEP